VRLLGVGVHNFSKPGEEQPPRESRRDDPLPRLPFD
jgi:hypothetical protein